MKLTKEQKKKKAQELAEILKASEHLYFTGYKGLKFQEMTELRQQLRPLSCSYRVVKNALLAHALKGAGININDKKLLDGPNALLFASKDDPVSPARVLVEFAKDKESLKIKAGYVGGKWVNSAECRKLSAIGTKPELLGKLSGTLYSAVGQAAWVLAAPIQDLALTLKALQEKRATEGTA